MGNFFAELEAGFVANEDETALLLPEQDDWLYADLLVQINRIASQLASFGVSAGDRKLPRRQKPQEW